MPLGISYRLSKKRVSLRLKAKAPRLGWVGETLGYQKTKTKNKKRSVKVCNTSLSREVPIQVVRLTGIGFKTWHHLFIFAIS